MNATSRTGTKPRILVVEDEQVVARDIRQQLVDLRYDPVGHATRGEDAVAMAGALRPDLVLMDIQLDGDVDGIAAAQAIRDQFGLPVVYLTAFAEGDTLERAARTGAYGYIIKPFSERELHAVLEMALYRHQAEARLRESEENYRQLFDRMLDGFAVHEIICDGAGVPVDYRFLSINPAFERMTGLRAAGVVGRTVLEVMPGTEQLWVERYGRVALTGEGMHFEEYSSALQRHYEVAVFRPKPGQFATVFVDITARKRTEAKLSHLHEQHELILSSAAEGIIGLDAEGRHLFANPAAASMLGYSPEELVGLPGHGLWHHTKADGSVYPDAECAILAALQDGALHRAESDVFWRKDGTSFPVEYASRPIYEEGRTVGVVVTFSDISERQRAVEENRRLALMVESAPNAIAVHGFDGHFFYANSRNFALHGYSRDEFMALTVQQLDVPADAGLIDARIQEMMARGEAAFEVEHLRKDGSILPLAVSVLVTTWGGQPAILSVATDISERKRSAELLRQSDTLARTLFEQAGDGVVSLSAADLSIVSANESFARMHGYSVPEVLAMSLRDLDVPDATAHAAARVARLMAGEVLKFEVEHYHKDGHVFPVEVTANLVEIDGQRLILAFNRDITERRRAQAETAALEAQLQHAQKMESVGRLAGGVAHDFNNMLAVILGTTEVALEQVGAGEPLHADLEEIQRAARRSADLTRQLLAYARRETIAPEELDLNETVPGLLSMLQRLLGEDIHLLWAPATTLWPVVMDPNQLANVLTNLCVNARDAIADVGTIAIATENSTLDAAFCARHGDATPGDYVRLTVRDTGSGMDDALMAHIFEPFFTTKGAGRGTGLGLASVYGAVRQNHGLIAVSSVVGEGTTFHIYLPRLEGGVAAAQRATGETAAAARGQETILLVEDEPAILQLAARLLERQGYRVLSAVSPAEAVRVATQYDGEIHLLLTDVVMPGMNGRDLAVSLQTLRPRLRPLFMSGHTAGVISDRGILLAGAAFIEKPFSTQSLATKVREVLDAGGLPRPDSGRVA